MKVRGYITHKAAENYSDCADYFRICPRTKRVAVSDGVSQSTMPLEWAMTLVNAYVDGRWMPGQDVSSLQQSWLNDALAYLKAQKDAGNNPWMLENCLLNRDGAGATFCGVEFSKKDKWAAIILGDSCLVEIKDKEKITAIHSSNTGAFNNRPDYFDSFNGVSGTITFCKGEIDRKSSLLLVSDPFSELFQKVKGTPNETVIINEIFSLGNDHSAFERLVDRFREKYGMHNDDSTLLIIEYDRSDEITIEYQKPLEESQKEEALIIWQAEEAKKRRIDEDKALWDKASAANTIIAYQAYLDASRDKIYGPHAERKIKELQAKERIAADENDWQTALTENSETGFLLYIKNHSDGAHVNEVFVKIKNMSSVKTPEAPAPHEESGETEEDPVCCKGESITGGSLNETVSFQPEDKGKEKRIPSTGRSESISSKGGYLRPGTVYPEKVVKSKDGDSISVPEEVDPSDGIDRVEFNKIGGTAEKLFERYHQRLHDALNMPKWKDDRKIMISHCFKDFWSELESIIYNESNNG